MEKEKIKINVVLQDHPQKHIPVYIAEAPGGEIFGQTYSEDAEILEKISVPELYEINIHDYKNGNPNGLKRSPTNYEGFEFIYQ